MEKQNIKDKSIGTEITRQEILNQVEKELVEIGKTVRDYKLCTVANFFFSNSLYRKEYS